MIEGQSVFIFGTLLDPEIRQAVIGGSGNPVTAGLPGFTVSTVQLRLFPCLEAKVGQRAEGMILRDLSVDQLARLEFYLDPAICTRRVVAALCEGREVNVQTHVLSAGGVVLGKAWDYAQWAQDLQPAALQAAIQIMRSFAVAGVHTTPINHHGVDMRAHSNVRAARQNTPVQIRRGLGAKDVEDYGRTQPYAKYFAVEDMKTRHRLFNGGKSEVLDRAVYLAADAVTVLPYDPVTDRVLLIEQFRTAPFTRNDPFPWVLEPVAGRCDANESVETVAERELLEEAGLSLQHLEKIGSYYSSPGCVTEYLYSFVGIVDLAEVSSQTHGLESEGEDILTHVLPFEVAIDALETGEINVGPLVLSLLWLQVNRSRLQKEWGGA